MFPREDVLFVHAETVDDESTEHDAAQSAAMDADCATASGSNQNGFALENSRQTIDEAKLKEMKESGEHSTESIVQQLVKGNAAFGERSGHSKDKYIRKKSAKHAQTITLSRPTLRCVAESYQRKDADRIGHLRVDHVAELLARANVHAHQRVLVFDQCLGLATAAVLQQLGGCGLCVALHEGVQPQAVPCIHAMGFGDAVMGTWLPYPVSWLGKDGGTDAPEPPAEFFSEADEGDSETIAERRAKREVRRQSLSRAAAELNSREMRSLVVASRNCDLVSLLDRLKVFLQPAAPIAIYSTYIQVKSFHAPPTTQPLLSLERHLRCGQPEMAVDVRLSENMCRRLQVLHERTHPQMQQCVSGGYLLSAILL